MELKTPKEVSKMLGISTATITRCVKRGAPVHRWGSTGRRYRISIPEFVSWMESQGAAKEDPPAIKRIDARAMAIARRAHVQQLAG